MDEKRLIESAKNGNKIAFEQLIINYEKKVYNIALHMVKNEEDAKDIAQESLIKIYKNIKKFNGKSSFSTWIYRVTVNTTLDHIRRMKAKMENDNYSLDEKFYTQETKIKDLNNIEPEPNIIKKERMETIKKALNLLNEEQKTVIVLRDIQGFSYNEIAKITNTTEGTVKSRINRSRKKLKEILMQTELFKKENV